jgi:hypothetical protein
MRNVILVGTLLLAFSTQAFAKEGPKERLFKQAADNAAEMSLTQKITKAVRAKGCTGAFVGDIEVADYVPGEMAFDRYFVETTDCVCSYYETYADLPKGSSHVRFTFKTACYNK